MDQLFVGSMEDLKGKLTGIEPEMCEDCYSRMDSEKKEELSECALKYIVRVASHMSRNYLAEKRTVLNLMSALVRVAATGEYAFLQEDDDLGFEDDVFEHLKENSGYDQILYALRLVKYYYQVFEKKLHPASEWKQITEVYAKFRKMGSLNVYRERGKKPDPHEIPEDEFIPLLRKHFDRYMIGQDGLKKILCTIVFLWKYYSQRTVLLMIGPSGSGKNYVIETLRSFPGLGRTVTCFDCSRLTPAGFNGGDVGDIFKKLKQDLAGERRKQDEDSEIPDRFRMRFGEPPSYSRPDSAESIVYLDEIDKIINFNHDSNGENVNAMVQQGLLSALAGTEVIEGVDTSKILFILGGAFPRIDELEQRKKRCEVGFNPYTVCVPDYLTSLRDQIMEIGGEPEFVGRIQEIVKIGKYSRDDLKAILMDDHIGAFTRKQNIFKKSGLQLSIDDDAVDAIVDLIENEPAGARSAKNIINQFADSSYFYDMKMGGYNSMRIHKGMLSGEPPIFTKGGVPDAKVLCHA